MGPGRLLLRPGATRVDWLTLAAARDALGSARRSSDWTFSFGRSSFIYNASIIGRRHTSLHVTIISVLSSSIFLVSVVPCSLSRCCLGTPLFRWKVSRRDNIVVVMPI